MAAMAQGTRGLNLFDRQLVYLMFQMQSLLISALSKSHIEVRYS